MMTETVIATYVAMQHYNDTPKVSDLGASPAELDGDVEHGRAMSWADHDGSAELRLWEDDNE